MVIRVQQRAEALGHLNLSGVGPQEMNVCRMGRENEERWDGRGILEFEVSFYLLMYLFVFTTTVSAHHCRKRWWFP